MSKGLAPEMKRDWDLIRKQLTDVEEENDLFADSSFAISMKHCN
jgi:hypothetical protein